MTPRDLWRSWGRLASLVFIALMVIALTLVIGMLDALGVLVYVREFIGGGG